MIRIREVSGRIFVTNENEVEGSSDDRLEDQLSEDDDSNTTEEEFSNEEDKETFGDSIFGDSSPEIEHNHEARDETIKNSNEEDGSAKGDTEKSEQRFTLDPKENSPISNASPKMEEIKSPKDKEINGYSPLSES
ncbi:hypothetical protein L2E82_07425 [Cichorium intybus]|uniref:Uncharacterized protein n=1 Tax=Cichorium intybus TaxID=13427 RepID=A0ACB9G5B6_CICIN|nr:hypothetical protein L2E82_07425 [Cichorium intybus]